MNKNTLIYILLIIGLLLLINGFVYPITLFFILGLSCLIVASYIYIIHPPSMPTIYTIYKSSMSPTNNSSNYTNPLITVVITPQKYVSYYTVSTISPSSQLLSISSSSNIITISPTVPAQDSSGSRPLTYDYTIIVTATNSFGTSEATQPTTLSFFAPVQPVVTYVSPVLRNGFISLVSNYTVKDPLPIVINPAIDVSGSCIIQLHSLPPQESFYMIQLINQTTSVSSITYTYPNVDVSGNTFPITVCIGPFGQDGQYSVSITEYTLYGPSLATQFSIWSMYSLLPNG